MIWDAAVLRDAEKKKKKKEKKKKEENTSFKSLQENAGKTWCTKWSLSGRKGVR